MNTINPPNSTLAQQVAQAARAFQQHSTGHAPKGVTVILSGETLRITLHDALSPAEKAAAGSESGAEHLQNFTGSCMKVPADPCSRKLSGSPA